MVYALQLLIPRGSAATLLARNDTDGKFLYMGSQETQGFMYRDMYRQMSDIYPFGLVYIAGYQNMHR